MTDDKPMNQEDQTDEQEVKPEQKPGALLKAAREREGLSVEEVAKTLYMTRSKLCALENDEYEKLTSEVFVQGYLRKYAPIVGMDAEVLVSNYQRLLQHLRQTVDSIDDRDEEIPTTLIPKFVVPAAVFGVVAVVLIAVFNFTGDGDSKKSSSPLSIAATNTQIDETLEVGGNVAATSEIVGDVAAERINTAANPLPVAGVETSSSTNRPVTLDVARSAPVTATAKSDLSSTDNAEVALANSESVLGESELKFEFSEDCWIEVRDRIDAIIFTDLAKAGDSIEVQGEPPFSISLGNAQAVTLYWGDEQINTQPRPGFRTAKFVVGE